MKKVYVVMVGLPARGKSTLAKRIKEGLEAEGLSVGLFNNGTLRRAQLGEDSAEPAFYHPQNAEGRAKREAIACENMLAAQQFLATAGHVAILDATNVSRNRRAMLEATLCDAPLLFVECTNNDPLLLDASLERKASLPEFAGKSHAEAKASFIQRMHYYQELYTPLQDESCWVRLDAVDNRIIAERLDHYIPYYHRIRDILVSDWVRNLYLARHGETTANVQGRIGGDPSLTGKGLAQADALARHFADIPITHIFTSTRQRSAQTAAPLQAMRPDCMVTALSEFDEIDAGLYEDMRYEDIRREFPHEYEARARDKYYYTYPEGEGYCTLRARVELGLRRAMFLAGDAKGVMLIGHQAINRMILSHFLYRRTEDVPFIYIPQNQYYHIVATQRKRLFELVPFFSEEENKFF